MLSSSALWWSYSGTVTKGRRRDLRCNYDVSRQRSSKKCVWGGCRQHLFLHPDAPSSMLPLLPELQVLSRLVAVGERVTHACPVCVTQESPSTAGLVTSALTGVRSVLWGEFLISLASAVVPHDLSAAEAALESSSQELSTVFSFLVWRWLYSGVSSFREDFEVHQLSWVEWDVSTSSNAFPNRTVLLTCVCFGPKFVSYNSVDTAEKDISCRSSSLAKLPSECMGRARGAGGQPQHWPAA